MDLDLVRIRKDAPLEATLLAASAGVEVALHQASYTLEVTTHRDDRRRGT